MFNHAVAGFGHVGKCGGHVRVVSDGGSCCAAQTGHHRDVLCSEHCHGVGFVLFHTAGACVSGEAAVIDRQHLHNFRVLGELGEETAVEREVVGKAGIVHAQPVKLQCKVEDQGELLGQRLVAKGAGSEQVDIFGATQVEANLLVVHCVFLFLRRLRKR